MSIISPQRQRSVVTTPQHAAPRAKHSITTCTLAPSAASRSRPRAGSATGWRGTFLASCIHSGAANDHLGGMWVRRCTSTQPYGHFSCRLRSPLTAVAESAVKKPRDLQGRREMRVSFEPGPVSCEAARLRSAPSGIFGTFWPHQHHPADVRRWSPCRMTTPAERAAEVYPCDVSWSDCSAAISSSDRASSASTLSASPIIRSRLARGITTAPLASAYT
jgi:hypothetical protein